MSRVYHNQSKREDEIISGDKFNEVLKNKYNSVHGDTPAWADLDAKPVQDEEDEDAINVSAIILSILG